MAARRQITGFSNPTVKYLRSLRDKKHRRREGKFLAEGLRLLTDARESGRLPEEYEAACDVRVTLPMKGRADSLNAAVAGAVLAYEVLAYLD